jgi:hypothetical protein
MKKIIFFLLISFIYIQCSAQTRLIPGEMKGKDETFIIDKIQQFASDKIAQIGVYSKGNKYNSGIPYSKAQIELGRRFLPINPKRDVHVNNAAVKQIVYGVLSKQLDALKQNREDIDFLFVFEPNGTLVDISYILPENTLISLQDIEEIDLLLRANIKATFTGKQYLQYIAINYHPPIIVF